MSTPLLTIGITCYNEGDWLLDCWQSVVAQTDERWEAVLVMDGTTHRRTREIFVQLEHPKLHKYDLGDNLGAYRAGNKAFELAQTPYVFWLAGDDQLVPDTVRLMLETFARNPDAGFVYGDYEYFGNREGICYYPREVTAGDLVEGQPTPGAAAYQRALWEQLGGFSTELTWGNGDYDFLIGAYEAGKVGRHCGAVYYRYRVGHTSVSKSYECRYYETHEIMVTRHPKFFQDAQRRDRFLALGYRRAALANYIVGDMRPASDLARAAIRHGLRSDYRLWILAANRILPSWARRFQRWTRQASGKDN